MTISKRDFLSMGGALGAGLALPAWAQAKPLFDTINMFVPAAPGGGWDGTARAIERAAKASGLVGNFQFENVGGAGGMIAAAKAARSAPDGYTIGMVTVSSHGINTTLYGERMRFDAVKDFAPIILAAELKNVIVVHPSIPAKTVPELIAYAKANPDKISFGSAGTGTTWLR